ncbi:MAG: chitobiase/beta-hexosaminidase C-terminal domain-containing protein, partial [Bacteroidaceae bacterium]|nr:chitobiase/beta-hexosaminidase C-terminal domain-containing protein [Bacteroidaceae bacterium]
SNIKTAGEHTDGAYTIKIDPTANKGSYIYDSKGFLYIGKAGSKIVLPAFGFAVEKIEVVGHSSATSYPNVDMNVYVGKTAVSTACIGSTATSTFEIAAANQAAGNVYELVIGSNGGNYSSIMYITYIKVYPVENKLEAPTIDLAGGVYVGEQTVNVHSATTDLEGVTDVTYYYTTDGNEPTVEDEETDGAITITESCTLKVVVELTYGDKVYVSASSSAEYIITEEATYPKTTTVASGSYFIAANGCIAAPIEGTTLPVVEAAIEGENATAPAYYAVTLEEAAGGYYIKDVNGNYIYNSMMTPHKLLSGTYAPTDVWTITIADDENSTAMIVCNEYALAFQNGVFCTVAVSEVANAVLPTLYGVEETTDIEKVESQDKEVKGIYDLTGRKVEKITKSGIYVVDGKKRLVK